MTPWKSWSRYRFCWGGCWTSFARGWKRERLRLRSVRIRFELQRRLKKDFQDAERRCTHETKREALRKSSDAAGANAQCKDAAEIVASATAKQPSASANPENLYDRGCRGARVAQNGLFVPCGPDPEKLEVTIARLGKLVGEGNLGCAELAG